MMKKTCVLLLLLSVFFSTSVAQKKSVFRIGAEVGSGYVEGDMKDTWNIRQDVDAYHYGHYASGSRLAYAESNFFYLGIKPQVSLWNNRVNLYSGLRFTMFDGNLGNKSGKNFFYFRAENPNAIEFYKIAAINEKRGYLSVPLEISYNIFRIKFPTPNTSISFFAKAGTEVGLNVLSKRNVDFVSSTMQSHESEVLGSVEKPNNFYSTFYFTMGSQLTIKNGMQFNIEGIVPSQILTKNNNTVIEPNLLSGVQLSVQFPLSMFVKSN